MRSEWEHVWTSAAGHREELCRYQMRNCGFTSLLKILVKVLDGSECWCIGA